MPSTLPANGFDWTWRKSRRKPPNSKKMIITFAKKCEILGLSSEVSPICTDGLVVWCFFNFRETWVSRPPRRNSVRPPLRKKKASFAKNRGNPKPIESVGTLIYWNWQKNKKTCWLMMVDVAWDCIHDDICILLVNSRLHVLVWSHKCGVVLAVASGCSKGNPTTDNQHFLTKNI